MFCGRLPPANVWMVKSSALANVEKARRKKHSALRIGGGSDASVIVYCLACMEHIDTESVSIRHGARGKKIDAMEHGEPRLSW